MCVCVCVQLYTHEFVCVLLGGEISQLPQLLLCVCGTIQDEALALIDSTRHMTQSVEVQEDSMETDAPRNLQTDQRDGVSSPSRRGWSPPPSPGSARLRLLIPMRLHTSRQLSR